MRNKLILSINKAIIAILALILVPLSGEASIPKFLLNKDVKEADYNNSKTSEYQNQLLGPKTIKPTLKRNYDVQSYSLDFDWYDLLLSGNRDWRGNTTIKLKVETDTMTQIEMDAASIIIEKVKMDSKDLNFFQDTNEALLYIYPDKTLKTGEIVEVNIAYRDTSNLGKNVLSGQVGINYYPQNPQKSVFENIAYTMAEPRDARHWMPCNDISFDRATLAVRVRVPAGYTAVANGNFVDSLKQQDTAVVFRWKHDFEMPTYLYSIVASKFNHYSDTVKLASGRALELPYYFWKEFLPAGSTKMPILDWTGKMVSYFSKHFFEYPYEKYGIVFVPNFGGGMEHSSLITVDNGWRHREYSGFAHELAHQWLGDYITCADWQDLWINEGGATWSAALWMGEQFGEDSYKIEILRMMSASRVGNYFPPVYDLPDDLLFNYSLTYAKAGMFYQMMSQMLGREQYLKTLQTIMKTYPLTSITTEQFREVVKKENPSYPLSWDKFFEQWLLMRGYPKYEVNIEYKSLNTSSDSTITTIYIKQTQDGEDVPEIFEMPVPLIFTKNISDSEKEAHNRRYYMNKRVQTFVDTLDFMPVRVTIDDLSIIHSSKLIEENLNDGMKSNVENRYALQSSISPNVSSAGNSIQLRISSMIESSLQVELFDGMGRLVTNFPIGDNLGIYNLQIPQTISAGIYYLKLKYNGISDFHKLIIK